jgi:hypothetical protein
MKIIMKKVAGFHSLDLASLDVWGFESRRRNLGSMEYQKEGWRI